MTREHGPTGVGLDTDRAMCDAAGLGPVGFNAGFLPHDGGWPTGADVPLADRSSC